MNRSRISTLVVIFAALGVTLVLAACGSSQKGAGSPGNETREASEESASKSESSEGTEGAKSEGSGSTGGAAAGEAGASEGGAAAGPAVLTTKSNKTFGTVLAAGPNKLTVYMFAADHGGESVCYSTCAAVWPPLTTTGKPRATGGVATKQMGLTKRKEGTTQVTYAGHPLYYYAPDKSEADVLGEGVNSAGGIWYLMRTDGEVVKSP